jgi:predicted transcriptional regulator of viral defense system
VLERGGGAAFGVCALERLLELLRIAEQDDVARGGRGAEFRSRGHGLGYELAGPDGGSSLAPYGRSPRQLLPICFRNVPIIATFCERMEARARRYVENLLGRGRHTFTRAEAEAGIGSSSVGTYHALRRLEKHGWLAMPRRGFYLIVDPEHRALGALPPTAWIDDLMHFHEAPYYVGLLSAAALHGAAHQQPQEFQVISGRVLRPLTVGRVRIRFFFRRHIEVAVTERRKTSSGSIPVSTAEMTAYDLVRYRKGAGSLDHVTTVLSELAEQMDAERLRDIAVRGDELPVFQRLGYLLEATGNDALAAPLHALVEEAHPKVVLLEPGSSEAVLRCDSRWRVRVNTSLEVEA